MEQGGIMYRKRLQQTFCWKINGELKLFQYQILQKEKEVIYHAAYQIDCIISIYKLLLEMSRRMSKETLEAAIAFPDILEFIYEEWMGYKDSYAEELQFCLNQELGKIRAAYQNMKEENER